MYTCWNSVGFFLHSTFSLGSYFLSSILCLLWCSTDRAPSNWKSASVLQSWEFHLVTWKLVSEIKPYLHLHFIWTYVNFRVISDVLPKQVWHGAVRKRCRAKSSWPGVWAAAGTDSGPGSSGSKIVFGWSGMDSSQQKSKNTWMRTYSRTDAVQIQSHHLQVLGVQDLKQQSIPIRQIQT
jgi:hypothetical protein